MRTIIVLSVILAAAPIAWQTASACGDKFLMVGRGARFQRAYAAIYPGNILIYVRPSAGADAAIRDAQFQKGLRQAGHSVSVIEDMRLLEQALHTASFDIVLADVADAPTIDPLIAIAPSKPRPLYVMYPSATKQQAIKNAYACKLKAGDRATKYLDIIEDEMQARAPKRGTKR